MIFMGSMPTPTPILRLLGGAGSAAARARNLWMMLVSALSLVRAAGESSPGSATPACSSTHVPHPSAQLLRSLAACSDPRCSTHPGQAHSSPQVQPEPAREVIVLIGGMVANVGMDGEGADSLNRMGGRSGPGAARSILMCFVRL